MKNDLKWHDWLVLLTIVALTTLGAFKCALAQTIIQGRDYDAGVNRSVSVDNAARLLMSPNVQITIQSGDGGVNINPNQFVGIFNAPNVEPLNFTPAGTNFPSQGDPNTLATRVTGFTQPLFRTRVPYFNGQNSYQASSAPLSGDGGLAVFTTNYTASTVSCYQVNADGILGAPVNTTVTGNPRMLALGDFNEDGLTDFAVSNRTTAVQVFFGTGGCNFAASANTQTMVSGTGQGIIAVKLANQSHQSIVVADRGSTAIDVFVGGGDGGFLTPWTATGCGGTTSLLKAADFNQDSNVDIAIACGTNNEVGLLFGTSTDGGFLPVQTTATRSVTPIQFDVGDLNGDGEPDIVVGGAGGSNSRPGAEVLLGQFALTAVNSNNQLFQSPSQYFSIGQTNQPGIQGITIGDFNGDHQPDVAVNLVEGPAAANLSSQTGVQFMAGNGFGQLNGNLGVSSLIPKSQGQPTWTFNSVFPLYSSAVDLNGDGVDDLIVPNSGSGTPGAGIPNLWVLLSGAPPTPVSIPEGMPVSVQGWPGGNLGVSPGPATFSTATCTSAYGTYLGQLPSRRHIQITTVDDSSPIYVGGPNVCAAPGYGFSSSDAGFVDAGACQPGWPVTASLPLSLDLGINGQWTRSLGLGATATSSAYNGLYCTKLTGAQDNGFDGGWTIVEESP